MADFLPRPDADVLSFTANFSARISAEPEVFGLTPEIAADYAAKQSAFALSMAAANDPMTRGGYTVNLKEIARREIVDATRQIVRTVTGTVGVTEPERLSLGLKMRKPGRTAIQLPAEAPRLTVVSVIGRAVRLSVTGRGTARLGKIADVAGAAVYSFIGAAPPADPAAWHFEQNTTRSSLLITFPNTLAPGSAVWFMAAWVNPRLQPGPTCDGVGTYLAGGTAIAAA